MRCGWKHSLAGLRGRRDEEKRFLRKGRSALGRDKMTSRVESARDHKNLNV